MPATSPPEPDDPAGPTPPGAAFVLRDPAPGDIGWIIHRQARLYALEYGWDWTDEALVAEIAARFPAHGRGGGLRAGGAAGAPQLRPGPGRPGLGPGALTPTGPGPGY